MATLTPLEFAEACVRLGVLDAEAMADIFSDDHGRRYPSASWADSDDLRDRSVWEEWPTINKKGERGHAANRRRPVWANPGYLAGLANYVHYGYGLGGKSKGDLETLDSGPERFAPCGHCGALWWGSPKGARPIGCGKDRFCTLCGAKAAGKLARGAQEFFFDEAMPAALAGLEASKRNAECAGGMATWPMHKVLSRELMDRMCEDDEAGPALFRKEINWLRREVWALQENIFGVGRLGGNSRFQFYGESNPGDDHGHFHNTVVGVALNGEKEVLGGDIDIDTSNVPAGLIISVEKSIREGHLTPGQGQTAYRRYLKMPDHQASTRRVKGGVRAEPLPRYLSDKQLEAARLGWGKIQVRCMLRLGVSPYSLGAELQERFHRTRGQSKTAWVLVGDFHWNYWGWKGPATPTKWADAMSRGRGVVSYTQRWDGSDFSRGIQSDGLTYEWTKMEKGKRVRHSAVLTDAQVRRFFQRLDKAPGNWPKSVWMGWMSSGEIGSWMSALGWEREKIVPEEREDDDPGVLKPVGRTVGGLRFQRLDGDNEGDRFLVPWGAVNDGPVKGGGRPLYKGRTHHWVSTNQKGGES